jgi:hypothetical protein
MTRESEAPSGYELHELVRRLPREIEPPLDLWRRIAARLDAPLPRSLEARARELPADIAPPVDLWPQIAARLRAEPQLPRTRLRFAVGGLAAAAALLLAVLAVLAVRNPGADGDAAARVAPDGGRPDSGPSTALGAAWMLRSPVISEDVAATLQRELTLVRDERLRIEVALDREPENSKLRELWAYTYQIELQLTDACGRTVMAYERG